MIFTEEEEEQPKGRGCDREGLFGSHTHTQMHIHTHTQMHINTHAQLDFCFTRGDVRSSIKSIFWCLLCVAHRAGLQAHSKTNRLEHALQDADRTASDTDLSHT